MVSLASRPQLVHTPSKQSVTASDDYYSLTSEGSSNDDRTAIHRYATPPMHRPANESRDAVQSEATIPSLRTNKQKNQEQVEKPTVASAGHNFKGKPVSSSSSSEGTIVRRTTTELSPPTPGVDDTPYIQFAIDQLTRDEEVAGTRHQSAAVDPSHPLDRAPRDDLVSQNPRACGGPSYPVMHRQPDLPRT